MAQRESELTAKPSWGRRLIGMEGLRGIAAIAVLMGHVDSHLATTVDLGFAGKILGLFLHGLTLFFALSGFLLYRSFASALITGVKFPAVGRFFQNRVLRIFPAYLVIFALVSFVIGAAYLTPANTSSGIDGVGQTVGYLFDPLKILPNLFMLQTFFPFSMKTGLGVAWSLTVELVFYLVLPVLAIAAWKLAKRMRAGSVLPAFLPAIAVFAIGTVGKIIYTLTYHPTSAANGFFLNYGDTWYAVFARSFLVHGDLFAFGMIAAVLLALATAGRIRYVPALRWGSFLVAGAGVVLSVAVDLGIWSDTAYAISFGALILFVALPGQKQAPGVLARVLEIAPIRFFGLISYSLYLWHVPVIWTLDRLGWVAPATRVGFVLNCVIVIAVTGALSTLTYFFIEKPPLKLKKRTDTGSAETPAPKSSVVSSPGREVLP